MPKLDNDNQQRNTVQMEKRVQQKSVKEVFQVGHQNERGSIAGNQDFQTDRGN